MKSPSAAAYALGVQAAATFEADLMRCRHPQAEPVILTTGELVACVCIGCYQQLPADYIERQAAEAHMVAYCTHRFHIDHESVMKTSGRRYTCTCGSWMSDDTFPTVHPGVIQ